MITTRYIDVAFGGARSAMARALYQYDYGQILRITDLVLPFAYEVHFSDTKSGNSVTMIGNADGVEIPDACLLTSGNVYCWFYLHDTESDGETRYEVLIPILSRAKPTNAAPTPVQQDVIDQAIAALDAAVQQTGEDVIAAGASASAAAGSVSDAEAWAVGERDGEPVESTDPTYHNNSKYYAGEAASAAQTASQDAQTASDAATAAGNAKTAAETAQSKAETAQYKAETARTAVEAAAGQTALDVIAAGQSANAAAGSAGEASGYANDASGYATLAQGFANNASGFADNASGYATNAYNSAQAAAGSAGEASGYATTASGYATDAGNAKTAAQGAQTAAETAQGLAEAAQTGAEAAQTAAESARDAAIAATEDKAPVILDNASGNIVSIVDGAGGMNARSLVASMSPIQDLHGYENPWPAGGGANKLDLTACTLTDCVLVSASAGSVRLNMESKYMARATLAKADFPAGLESKVLNGESFAFEVDNNDNRTITIVINGTRSDSSTFEEFNASGNLVTATPTLFTAVTSIQFRFRRQGTVYTDTTSVVTGLRLSYGSTATTFTPYSNICPISGRTWVTAYRTGVNVWDEEWEIGTIDSSGRDSPSSDNIRSKNYIPVIAGATYYYKSTETAGLRFYDADKSFLSSAARTKNGTFTVPANARFLRFVVLSGYGATYLHDISINFPATDTAYHPHTGGNAYPVSWQTEAGTVYGGTVDVVTGVLTVEYEKVTLSEFSGVWDTANPNGTAVYAAVSGTTHIVSDSSMMKSNIFSYTSEPRASAPLFSYGGLSGGSVTHTFILPSSITTKEQANAWLSNLGTAVECIFRLATPQTYQLDPQTVSMLLGANNVWSTGDTVDLTYPCDTKLYIEKLTQPTEDDMVANANIPIHQYFMIGNSLYYSTAAIASGESIVVGSNCSRVSLADVLNQINA